MAVFTEGNLQIAFDNALQVRKFEGDSHGLAHCMKAVDCIVEFDDRYLFIEIKDPQAPKVPQASHKQYLERLKHGQLDVSLYRKYRDSFLYEWASGRVGKPIYYFVLIALDLLTKPLLSQRTIALERYLPRFGPGGRRPWPRPFVHGCGVFNMAAWNEQFPDYPVQRLTP